MPARDHSSWFFFSASHSSLVKPASFCTFNYRLPDQAKISGFAAPSAAGLGAAGGVGGGASGLTNSGLLAGAAKVGTIPVTGFTLGAVAPPLPSAGKVGAIKAGLTAWPIGEPMRGYCRSCHWSNLWRQYRRHDWRCHWGCHWGRRYDRGRRRGHGFDRLRQWKHLSGHDRAPGGVGSGGTNCGDNTIEFHGDLLLKLFSDSRLGDV